MLLDAVVGMRDAPVARSMLLPLLVMSRPLLSQHPEAAGNARSAIVGAVLVLDDVLRSTFVFFQLSATSHLGC